MSSTVNVFSPVTKTIENSNVFFNFDAAPDFFELTRKSQREPKKISYEEDVNALISTIEKWFSKTGDCPNTRQIANETGMSIYKTRHILIKLRNLQRLESFKLPEVHGIYWRLKCNNSLGF